MLPEITRGGAQPFLSLKMINKIKIKTASIQEQIEIVRILDNLFVKEQKIKASSYIANIRRGEERFRIEVTRTNTVERFTLFKGNKKY